MRYLLDLAIPSSAPDDLLWNASTASTARLYCVSEALIRGYPVALPRLPSGQESTCLRSYLRWIRYLTLRLKLPPRRAYGALSSSLSLLTLAIGGRLATLEVTCLTTDLPECGRRDLPATERSRLSRALPQERVLSGSASRAESPASLLRFPVSCFPVRRCSINVVEIDLTHNPQFVNKVAIDAVEPKISAFVGALPLTDNRLDRSHKLFRPSQAG